MSDINIKALTENLVELDAKLKSNKLKFEQAQDKIEQARQEILSQVRSYMVEAGQSSIGVSGLGEFKIVSESKYSVKDWGSLYEFILENRRPDLLQKRLTTVTLEEMIGTLGNDKVLELIKDGVPEKAARADAKEMVIDTLSSWLELSRYQDIKFKRAKN